MTWVPYLRKRSREYEKMVVITFPGMEALYSGFHCEVEFQPHEYLSRTDDWMRVADAQLNSTYQDDATDRIAPIKQYKVDGEYVRYGSPVIPSVAVLFHARGIEKVSYRNWSIEKWEVLAKEFPGAISIGTKNDMHVPGTRDCRDMALGSLMDLIASAAIVIGQSSGVMHLAALCDVPRLVWGDNKTYFNELQEKRYKETWNPLHTRVTWIPCDNWDPEPEQILDALKPKNVPAPQVATNCVGVGFPDNRLDQAGELLEKEIRSSIAKAKAERIPKSWQ
jgi:hypothetical protein